VFFHLSHSLLLCRVFGLSRPFLFLLLFLFCFFLLIFRFFFFRL